MVDPTEIVQDKVLNLKIATPVKITEDPSKSLKEEAIPGGSDSLDVSTDAAAPTSEEDKDELKGLGFDEDAEEAPVEVKKTAKASSKKSAKQAAVMEDDMPVYSINNGKTWEVWGTMYVNSLSGTKETETENAEATSVSASSFDFSAGVEKYFLNQNNFLKEFSLSLFLHKKSIESGEDIKSKTDYLEYGLGANYHFYNSAGSVNRLVGYGAFTVGKGSATLESKTATGDESVEGSNSFFSAGVGAKYVLPNGFGIRGILDYYSSSETYEYDTSTDTRTLAGPRIQFGLSYRF